MEGKSMLKTSGAPSTRSMLQSLVLHVLVLILLMLVPAGALLRSAPPQKELDIVFYRPSTIPIPPRAAPPPIPRTTIARLPPGPGAPPPAAKPSPTAPPGPDRPGSPELPPGPVESIPADPQPQPKAGRAGILAFKDKIASLATDRIAPNLGADARYGAADDAGRP